MYIDNVLAVPSAILQNPVLSTPQALAHDMMMLEVMHYDFDSNIKVGRIIIHRFVLRDVQFFFRFAYRLCFPIQSILPVNEFGWSDDASCAANNSSGHNMRFIENSDRLSLHGIGCALDTNPRQNPCHVLGEDLVHRRTIPEDGKHVPGTPGTLHKGHPLVRYMVKRGWTWGGDWTYPVDYQHLQKNRSLLPPELASYVQ